jgi:ubiquitin carboxyl-terminal hydrolase 22/27/51
MYNLGNQCYMTAILQCLIHSTEVQHYFLRDVGHNHHSCKIYRDLFEKKVVKSACLACEMDKLFLAYFENTHGLNLRKLLGQLSDTSRHKTKLGGALDAVFDKVKGEPLVTSDMLTVAWKCISHIAGYEQRDAHEFFHSFLDVLGKHTRQYRVRVHNTINIPRPNNAYISHFDAAQQGKRSV